MVFTWRLVWWGSYVFAHADPVFKLVAGIAIKLYRLVVTGAYLKVYLIAAQVCQAFFGGARLLELDNTPRVIPGWLIWKYL